VNPRRRLVFFTTADPRTDPGPAGQAYHFATVAARTGLDAEVRLAGDAVRVAQLEGVAPTPAGRALHEKASEAGAPYLVSL
jgi:predicted peroxiredoxin